MCHWLAGNLTMPTAHSALGGGDNDDVDGDDDDDDAIRQIQTLTVGAVVLAMVRGSWEGGWLMGRPAKGEI